MFNPELQPFHYDSFIKLHCHQVCKYRQVSKLHRSIHTLMEGIINHKQLAAAKIAKIKNFFLNHTKFTFWYSGFHPINWIHFFLETVNGTCCLILTNSSQIVQFQQPSMRLYQISKSKITVCLSSVIILTISWEGNVKHLCISSESTLKPLLANNI